MPIPETIRNGWLDGRSYSFAQAYSGDPAGAGTPLGSRVAVTFGAAAAGVRTQTGSADLPVDAAGTVDHIAFWSAGSGGTLEATDDVTPEVYAAAGVYQLSGSTITVA